MLTHPTLQKMKTLRLFGMAQAFEDQLHLDDGDRLSFEDRIGLLLDREEVYRDTTRLKTRLRQAKLSQSACVEDVDLHSHRGLDKSLWATLVSGDWVRTHLNLILTGPTGVGKTYLACALGHQVCRQGYRVEYHRATRLFPELSLAKGDGRYGTLLRRLAKTDLLILDDWGVYTFTDESRRDLLELLEDRCGKRSTLLTSQLPLDHWHEYLGDPTLADAILDRLVHDAYKISLKGESMRKRKSPLQSASPENKENTNRKAKGGQK